MLILIFRIAILFLAILNIDCIWFYWFLLTNECLFTYLDGKWIFKFDKIEFGVMTYNIKP